ncbi:permease prefix domain 1-containing protein [Nonomuraea longicatena]|uniref:Uncharacterized protein n=1 Tax=Nonomuraea longicatena TaxID=83682 RepID=A0ABN1QKY3_9ACTN
MRIDDYVAELERAMTGPARFKRDLVVEARDSLTDAADAMEDGGLDRAEAERLAVLEFGEVEEIAPGYQAELQAHAGRRLGVLLFVSVPAITLCWGFVWHFFPADQSAWAQAPGWYSVASKVLDYAQLAIGVAGGLAALALGRGARLLGRARLVTRSLGGAALSMLALTAVLGTALSLGSHGPEGFASYLPGLVVAVATYALAGLQLLGAVSCLRVTRPAARRA